MIIQPLLDSHNFPSPPDLHGRVTVTVLHGTVFDDLSLKCHWSNDLASYAITEVILSFRPKRVVQNPYAPWAKSEDRRFLTKEHSIAFSKFCALIAASLQHVDRLDRILQAFPDGTKVSVNVETDFVATMDGMFLQDWPYAPIFTGDERSQKAAALAVLELLEVEADLPSEVL